MEDVRRQRAIIGVLLFYLCGCCIVSSVSIAATQGTIGQSSTGLVSITVHIPRTVRLLASQTGLSSANHANYCLSVVDANAPGGLNYYRVNTVTDSSTKLQKRIQSRWLQLNNVYGAPENSLSTCKTETLQVNTDSAGENRSNSVVLMLVPE